MYYKISNTAAKDTIENKFKVKFEFPNIYKPESVIEGLNESTVPVILAHDNKCIKFAIWGLLPEDFEDNWSVFQEMLNTLNVKVETLKNGNALYYNALYHRRCVIVATGFFTSVLRNGSMERCHVHLKNHEPFALAGVFNQLNDGFLTCSLLVTNVSGSFKNVPNISDIKPLVLNDIELSLWLNESSSRSIIHEICESHKSHKFYYDPIINLN